MLTQKACNAGVALLLTVFSGCGGSSSTGGSTDEPVVHVYNWADYIGASTTQQFEARTGIKVVYDVFDAPEVVETKLLTGHSGYDVVVPSGATTYRLVQAGALRPLDISKLKNYRNLDLEILNRVAANDPGNKHAIPYLRGTTGIGYNPALVEKAVGVRTIDSLAAIFDPDVASKLAKCGITWLDTPLDMFALAMAYLGRDLNSDRTEDLKDAEALLTRARPYVRYFHSSQYLNDLASGEICVAAGWSGMIHQARVRGAQSASPVEVVYVIPKEGAPLWCDMAAIPVDAPHVEHAYAFIDHLLEARVIAEISNEVGQANGNAASLPLIDESIRNDPSIYPSAEVMKRLTIDRSWSEEHVKRVARAWARIRVHEQTTS